MVPFSADGRQSEPWHPTSGGNCVSGHSPEAKALVEVLATMFIQRLRTLSCETGRFRLYSGRMTSSHVKFASY